MVRLVVFVGILGFIRNLFYTLGSSFVLYLNIRLWEVRSFILLGKNAKWKK